MKGVVNTSEGTGTLAKLDNGQEVAAKTGTSSEYHDITFCGITPQLSVAIWFGDPSNQETIPTDVSAADVFKKFMTAVLYGKSTETFPQAANPTYKAFSNATYHVGTTSSSSSSNSTNSSGSSTSNQDGSTTGSSNSQYGTVNNNGNSYGYRHRQRKRKRFKRHGVRRRRRNRWRHDDWRRYRGSNRWCDWRQRHAAEGARLPEDQLPVVARQPSNIWFSNR